MGIVVQKYGGTSLRDISNQKDLLTHVKECINEGNKLVIVVSAMGRKGEPYATDTLIDLLENINDNVDPKKKDLIMSCGEIISAAVVSHILDVEGIPSEALTGFQAGILTNEEFTSSEIIDIDISKIAKHISEGKIVVVAGFQGNTKDKEITTLGRGGSDTTAVALGGHLKAERVDIFTDVPGVAVIDPDIVPTTKYIDQISYDDMHKLASNGVGVIHPRAVLAGKEFNIPIRIRSTYSNGPGTLISHLEDKRPKKITGIALKKQIETGIISVFFKNDDNIKFREDFEKYLLQDNERILEIFWYDDKVSIMVESHKILFYAEKIYKYFYS